MYSGSHSYNKENNFILNFLVYKINVLQVLFLGRSGWENYQKAITGFLGLHSILKKKYRWLKLLCKRFYVTQLYKSGWKRFVTIPKPFFDLVLNYYNLIFKKHVRRFIFYQFICHYKSNSNSESRTWPFYCFYNSSEEDTCHLFVI